MSLKEFFIIQKSDRKVLLVLIGLALAAILVVFIIGGGHDTTPLSQADSLAMAEWTRQQTARDSMHRNYARTPKYYQVEGRTAELFPFDPNTADSTQLLRLGLQPWQVRNIYKYRAAGGVYRQPSDFARLYGLTVKQYRQLEPYIVIGADYQPAASLAGERRTFVEWEKEEREPYVRDTVKYPVKLTPSEHIALNVTDTTILKKVPGIGSGFAKAIVRYHDRLGGFYSPHQLTEIEGFPQEAVAFFQTDNAPLRKININRLSVQQMSKHPYISFFQAKAIEDYRRLKGPIENIRQLALLKDFTPEAIERLEPYLEY